MEPRWLELPTPGLWSPCSTDWAIRAPWNLLKLLPDGSNFLQISLIKQCLIKQIWCCVGSVKQNWSSKFDWSTWTRKTSVWSNKKKIWSNKKHLFDQTNLMEIWSSGTSFTHFLKKREPQPSDDFSAFLPFFTRPLSCSRHVKCHAMTGVPGPLTSFFPETWRHNCCQSEQTIQPRRHLSINVTSHLLWLTVKFFLMKVVIARFGSNGNTFPDSFLTQKATCHSRKMTSLDEVGQPVNHWWQVHVTALKRDVSLQVLTRVTKPRV